MVRDLRLPQTPVVQFERFIYAAHVIVDCASRLLCAGEGEARQTRSLVPEASEVRLMEIVNRFLG